MKKIINGKKYDTETAREIAQISEGRYRDFEYWEETLYLKKTGEFFLYCYGGAASRYGQPVGDHWTDSGKIEPLAEEDAKEWVSRNCDGDTYEGLFGEVEE